MSDEIIVEEEIITKIKKRDSGQEIGNPMPAQFPPAYEGTKANSQAWTRTKNKRYLKKRARQLITKGSQDKSLYAIIKPRRG